ncbi:MAG: hypothetical protein HYY04_00030 [Chloroflexi bacterium]|nr:hypothetical protein [Chloroflexota bacterium]
MSKLTVRGIALLAGLLLALAPWLAMAADWASPAAAEPVKIRVEVTDTGFNGQPEPVVEIEQGQMVELTFVWAHKGYLHEEHIIVLEGYKLESDKLTAENREYTFKFIADKAGSFGFKCDLDCEVHNSLQRGQIKVKGTGSSAASPAGAKAALTATTLTLRPSTWLGEDSPMTIMASLRDPKGAPVSKAEVRFFVDAEFAGTKGKMEVGRAKTDANGIAFFDYRPTLAAPDQKLTARFEGMGLYGESQQVVEIKLGGVPSPAYTVAPRGLEAIRRGAPVVLVLVILGVWTTFGFVLFQIWGIFRDRARG